MTSTLLAIAALRGRISALQRKGLAAPDNEDEDINNENEPVKDDDGAVPGKPAQQKAKPKPKAKPTAAQRDFAMALVFRDQMDGRIAAGRTQAEAVAEVSRAHPHLQQALVRWANRERDAEAARRRPSPRVEHPFQRAVQLKVDRGMPRAKAVALVARQRPDLQADFIRQANGS